MNDPETVGTGSCGVSLEADVASALTCNDNSIMPLKSLKLRVCTTAEAF